MPSVEPLSHPPDSGPEIIDVDLLDDDVGAVPLHRHSMQWQPYLIPSGGAGRSSAAAGPPNFIVIDSDDEQPSTSTAAGQASHPRFFSPPPPVRNERLPPVPPLPRHLSGQSSFPRRGPPPPPVVLPIDQPFPFEEHIRPRPRRASPLAPMPAARSQHQPIMGFGGAFLALNQRNNERQQENRETRESAETRTLFPLPSFGDIIRRLAGPVQGDAGPAHQGIAPWWARFLDEQLPVDDEEVDLDFLDAGHRWYPLARPASNSGSVDPLLWKPSYTHPDTMLPGFLSGFSAETISSDTSSVIVIDDDASSSAKSMPSQASSSPDDTTLVCARCLAPLILSNDESTMPSEEERRNRKVWALRCGHMLDGICIHELMQPAPTPAPALEVAPTAVDVKGKGKALDKTSLDPDWTVEDIAKPIVSDRKGKGKAREDSAPVDSASLSSLPSVLDTAESQDNSIRSRLRPRRPREDIITGSLASHPITRAHPERPTRPLPRRRGMTSLPPIDTLLTPHLRKTKGKGRAKGPRQPKVEEQFEWTCPVAGCDTVHVSIRVEGVWKMDPAKGAIGLFL